MKACIVSIGNELLNGQTADTNASWMAGRLFEMGIPTVGGWLVPDEIPAITEAFQAAADQADIILITGGLGPTDDDLTRQAFAKFLDVELEFHPELLDWLKSFFEKRGWRMADKNRSQAYIPAGCEVLDNNYGTAPGFWCQNEKGSFAVMPGVPPEMMQMFDEQVIPHIQKMHNDQVVVSGKVRCFGAGESTIAQKMGDLMDRTRNPLINCTCGAGDIVLHIIAQAQDRQTAEKMVQQDKKELVELLGNWIYGCDDELLPAVVGRLLREKAKTIALAESCTGGLVSKLLTDIPGSSEYVLNGWITYSNQAKIDQLGVSEVAINEFGAVSEPVARQMATGAAKKSGANCAIAITGVAGPDGGSLEKPVGLVYIALWVDGDCNVKESRFPAINRDYVRRRAALTALNLLRLKLQI